MGFRHPHAKGAVVFFPPRTQKGPEFSRWGGEQRHGVRTVEEMGSAIPRSTQHPCGVPDGHLNPPRGNSCSPPITAAINGN